MEILELAMMPNVSSLPKTPTQWLFVFLLCFVFVFVLFFWFYVSPLPLLLLCFFLLFFILIIFPPCLLLIFYFVHFFSFVLDHYIMFSFLLFLCIGVLQLIPYFIFQLCCVFQGLCGIMNFFSVDFGVSAH